MVWSIFSAKKRMKKAAHPAAAALWNRPAAGALAMAALAMAALTACGGPLTGHPAITADDLRPGSAVETAIEQGNTDKTYAWHWRALDIDACAAAASISSARQCHA